MREDTRRDSLLEQRFAWLVVLAAILPARHVEGQQQDDLQLTAGYGPPTKIRAVPFYLAPGAGVAHTLVYHRKYVPTAQPLQVVYPSSFVTTG